MSIKESPRKSELIPFAEGRRGLIALDKKSPGIAYKIPNRGYNDFWDSPLELLQYEKNAHDALVAFGIQTIPHYEIESYSDNTNSGEDIPIYRGKMTDLSNGARNLVISTTDIVDMDKQAWPELQRLASITRNRPLYNIEQFFTELKSIVVNMDKRDVYVKEMNKTMQGIYVERACGYCCVVTPEGEIHPYVIDYEDGVTLDTTKHLDWLPVYIKYRPVDYFLTTIIFLFPELLLPAKQFMQEISQGKYPHVVGDIKTKR